MKNTKPTRKSYILLTLNRIKRRMRRSGRLDPEVKCVCVFPVLPREFWKSIFSFFTPHSVFNNKTPRCFISQEQFIQAAVKPKRGGELVTWTTEQHTALTQVFTLFTVWSSAVWVVYGFIHRQEMLHSVYMLGTESF